MPTKYLGITENSKLSSKLNIEHLSQMFVSQWRRKPKISSLVKENEKQICCKSLLQNTEINLFRHYGHIHCVQVLRMISTLFFNSIPSIIMVVSASSSIKLNATGCWITERCGHARILDIVSSSLQTNFDKVFKIQIPTRSEGAKGNLIEGYYMKIFTDGSKMRSQIQHILRRCVNQLLISSSR